jgi:hypothetical protein
LSLSLKKRRPGKQSCFVEGAEMRLNFVWPTRDGSTAQLGKRGVSRKPYRLCPLCFGDFVRRADAVDQRTSVAVEQKPSNRRWTSHSIGKGFENRRESRWGLTTFNMRSTTSGAKKAHCKMRLTYRSSRTFAIAMDRMPVSNSLARLS